MSRPARSVARKSSAATSRRCRAGSGSEPLLMPVRWCAAPARKLAHGAAKPDEQPVRWNGCQPVPLDPIRKLSCRPGDPRRVDPVRADAGISADRARAAAQQRHRAPGVSALCVREAYRNLGQALPQVALGGLGRLPRCLKDLMRAKCPALINQLLRERERAGGRQRWLVGPGRPGWQA